MAKIVVSLLSALIVAAFGGGTFLRAAPERQVTPASALGPVITLRVQPPITGLVLWGNSDGAWTVAGTSLAVRLLRLFEIEGGATKVINPCEEGGQFTLRAGVSPSVPLPERLRASWDVRLPVLATGHFISVAGDGCDGHSEASTGTFDLAGGLDLTRWNATTTVGFNIRALVGTDLHNYKEAALAIGLSLH